MEPLIEDTKFIVFKRDEFMDATEPRAMNMATAEQEMRSLRAMALKDAVVIRRQDLFASPAFATYAAMIAIVIKGYNGSDPEARGRLLEIADYFQRQSEAAAEEGWKLPD